MCVFHTCVLPTLSMSERIALSSSNVSGGMLHLGSCEAKSKGSDDLRPHTVRNRVSSAPREGARCGQCTVSGPADDLERVCCEYSEMTDAAPPESAKRTTGLSFSSVFCTCFSK